LKSLERKKPRYAFKLLYDAAVMQKPSLDSFSEMISVRDRRTSFVRCGLEVVEVREAEEAEAEAVD
jgi:hypothetical protein